MSQTNSDIGCCGETCNSPCVGCQFNHKIQTVSPLKKFMFVFALILAAASLSVALWLQIARFESQRFLLGIDDQRTLLEGSGDFSTMFCSEYVLTVTSVSPSGQSTRQERSQNNGLISAYMLLEYPKRYTKRVHSREYMFNLTSSTDYVYWAYHLNNLDELFLHAVSLSCSNLTFYVFTENNFFQWLEDSRRGVFCFRCIYETFRPPCIANKTILEVLFSNKDNTEYVFLFQDQTLSSNSSLMASANFTIFRENLIINDGDVASSCKNATSCRLSVAKSAETIVFKMENYSSSSSVTLTTRCVPRVGMYLAYFIAVPLALWSVIAGILGLVWTIRKCQEDVILYTENADNARSMARLSTGPPPAYSCDPHSSGQPHNRSGFSIFARGSPRQQQLPLINYDATSEESEGVSRSPPAYGTIDRVSIPRSGTGMESQFEIYASTPPPDYPDAIPSRSQDETNTDTTA